MLPKPPSQSKRVIALSIAALVVAVKQTILAFGVTPEVVSAIGNLGDAIVGVAAAFGITAYGVEYRRFFKRLEKAQAKKDDLP